MRRVLALLLVVPALLLAGCAPTVVLQPAPQATSTACAGIVVRLPQTVGVAERRNTDSQGTAAWGTPQAVSLRCGVATPPTTDRCYSIGGVFWTTREQSIGGAQRRVLTTFGRTPGVQLVVDTGDVSADDALQALSEPIADATRASGQRCSVAPTS